MSKKITKHSIKDFKKNAVTNLLAMLALFGIDVFVVMATKGTLFRAETATTADQQILNWALITYIIIFIASFLAYKSITKENFKRLRTLYLVILVISVANLATFVVAQNFFSLLLIIPIAMLVYARGDTKKYLSYSK